jgi:hypothetical protein
MSKKLPKLSSRETAEEELEGMFEDLQHEASSPSAAIAALTLICSGTFENFGVHRTRHESTFSGLKKRLRTDFGGFLGDSDDAFTIVDKGDAIGCKRRNVGSDPPDGCFFTREIG